MDPVTILGAASSAVGIASFGLQLVQVLTKYATDAGAAAQNLKAALTNIRVASIPIEHINHFLEEESERSKLRQKATLNTAGIRQIQYIIDGCLKVFWRVEAWVLDKDESNELELRIANRLNEYKEDVKFGSGKPSQFVKVDEALAKVRKLGESRGSAVKNTMDTQVYDTTPQNIERLLLDLHPGSRRIDEMNHGSHWGVNEYDTQYMNIRFIQAIARTQFIPVTSGIGYIGNPYTQIPQSYVQQPDVYRRENPRLRRSIPPAVPDDPLKSSTSEASHSYIKNQELNYKNTDSPRRNNTVSENVIPSGDATIDAAQSHMAHFQATQKAGIFNDLDAGDTSIYPDYLRMVEKPGEVDNLSVIAQQIQKNFVDFEHVDSDGKLHRNLDGKAQYLRTRERGNTKPGRITPVMAPKASSTECNPNWPRISRVSRPDMHMNNLTKRRKTSDLRDELSTAAPSCTSLQAEKPKSEAPLDPKLEVSSSGYPKKKIYNDDFATLQKPTSRFIVDRENQFRNSDPQAVRFDLPLEDLEEPQTRVVEEPESPIIPQVIMYDETPQGTPEERTQIVTDTLLVALSAIIPSQSRLGVVSNTPEHNIQENCAVKKDDTPEEMKKFLKSVVEKFSENINPEHQIDTIRRSRPPSNLPVSPTVSSLTNRHSQTTQNGYFIKPSSMGGELNHDDDMDRMVPAGSFMTALFIKGHNYQQIPTVENFKLRKTEIERTLSQKPQQNWWKEFCFLEPAETDSPTQILKPQYNYRRELLSLREMKKSSSRLWWRSEKGHIAIIITKPLANLDTAPNSTLDFRYTPTRAATSSSANGVTFGTHVFGDIIEGATRLKIVCIAYASQHGIMEKTMHLAMANMTVDDSRTLWIMADHLYALDPAPRKRLNRISSNTHELLGSEHAGDDILQQLLLKWTPTGEEAEAASKQSEDESFTSGANMALNETLAQDSQSENGNKQPVEKQNKEKAPQQQSCNEVFEGSTELKSMFDGDQNGRYYLPKHRIPLFH
ncbi:8d9e666d-9df1-43bb-829c-d106b19e468d [Sclerotinia trifoliorum]|uniref:8d9e666d-9df1-43bb-829c-d106b19e468d n=1 Tax=Sclerotinia trifoliorum TaxID=28548 RepID=A0A8H2VWC8_9HELO|nr:8d9e666d-9df1-43bb-829c-d106b19e468d [Sclerotinia trifoliorum]